VPVHEALLAEIYLVQSAIGQMTGNSDVTRLDKVCRQYSLTLNSVRACATLSLARRHRPAEEQSLHLRVNQ